MFDESCDIPEGKIFEWSNFLSFKFRVFLTNLPQPMLCCLASIAAREKSTTVTMEHFESAIKWVSAGLEKETNLLPSGE